MEDTKINVSDVLMWAALFFAGMVVAFIIGVNIGERETRSPLWNCAAEDEVVVIDNTCVHVDALHGVHP